MIRNFSFDISNCHDLSCGMELFAITYHYDSQFIVIFDGDYVPFSQSPKGSNS